MASRFEKFSERARRVLTLAQEEAQRFNHANIGPEHILLGIVGEPDGVAAKVLVNLGVSLNKVRSAVEFIIGHGEATTRGEVGLSPGAKRVIELAIDEASISGTTISVPSIYYWDCCGKAKVLRPVFWTAWV